MSKAIMQQALKLLVSYREYTGDSRIANRCTEVIAEINKELAKPEQPNLRKAAEMAIPILVAYYHSDSRIANKCGKAIEALRQALSQPEQEPVWCGCGDGIVAEDGAKCGVCVMQLENQIERLKSQPEQPLDKKADNARELGLDYEPKQSILICSNCGADRAKEDCKGERTYCPFAGQAQQDHGFDRTASHMTGEYVDTAQPEPIVIMGHYVGEGKVVSASFGLPEGSFTTKPEVCYCENIQRCTVFDRCMKNQKD